MSAQQWRSERDRALVEAWNSGASQQALISRFRLTAIGIQKVIDAAREAGIEIKPRVNRKVCETIGSAVAAERRLSFEDLLFGQSDEAAAARSAAWVRILRETGATHRDLARAWGEPHTKVSEAVRAYRPMEAAQ